MAIICREHRILYIQVPGTGCSVVGQLLVDEFDGQELGRKRNDVSEIVRKGLCSPDEMREYLVLANIRKPFDRLVTYYQRFRGDWAGSRDTYGRARSWKGDAGTESCPEMPTVNGCAKFKEMKRFSAGEPGSSGTSVLIPGFSQRSQGGGYGILKTVSTSLG